LAQIHKSNLAIGLKPTNNIQYTEYSEWKSIQTKIQTLNYNWVAECVEFINSIKTLYPKINLANIELQKNLVFSHCDLDKKNVLWNKNEDPFIIDWESAGYINPVKEMLQFAFDWSIESNDKVNQSVFKQISEVYKSINEVDISLVEDGFYSGIGDTLEWLKFNLECVIKNNSVDEFTIAESQIFVTIKVVVIKLELKDNIILLLKQ
jgi:thiamine kinase-like enzyme